MCAQQGRSGATEKGAGGNHSIPGLVTRGLLIMQPKGVMLACQSCPERWHGKPHKGVCVCFGSDQEIASRSWRLGLRGPRLDAGATCLSTAAVCMAPGGPPSEQERTRFAGCLPLLGEVSGASKVSGAHSRNFSEPAFSSFRILVPTAPLGMLISVSLWL